MIIINGMMFGGWRLDELMDNSPLGLEFLANPFAIVPKRENAKRIELAFQLLAELRSTKFFETSEGWRDWFEPFQRKVDAVLNP